MQTEEKIYLPSKTVGHRQMGQQQTCKADTRAHACYFQHDRAQAAIACNNIMCSMRRRLDGTQRKRNLHHVLWPSLYRLLFLSLTVFSVLAKFMTFFCYLFVAKMVFFYFFDVWTNSNELLIIIQASKSDRYKRER